MITNDQPEIKTHKYPVDFLSELFEYNLRVIHNKIQLLDWDEKVIREIQGVVKNGSYNVDGNSSSRRNLTLTFGVKDRDGGYVANYLTPDKKIKLFIGLENFTNRFKEEPIIWFNMGIFILTEPSFSHGIGETTITFSAQDKMSMMNGTIGGKLPSPVSFIERKNGKNLSMSWREIFMTSAVNFGNENPARVVIDSVPDYINEYTQVKQITGMKDDFIFVDAPEELVGERIVTRAYDPNIAPSDLKKKVIFSKGERLYKLKKFAPPDPVAGTANTQESYQKNVGEPLTSIFDDIVEAVGHTHEYFYTRDGDLILQPIQNFLNEVFDPEMDNDLGYFAYELNMKDFVPNYVGLPFTYNFADKKTVVRYNNNPSYTNIKNDFVATSTNGSILEIAIDAKPTIEEITDWFQKIAVDFNMNSPEVDFLAKDGKRRAPYNPDTNTVPFEYKEGLNGMLPIYVDIPLDKLPWQIALGLKSYFIKNIYGGAASRILPRWGIECESMIFRYVADQSKTNLIPNTGIFNPSLVFAGTPWLAGYPVVLGANTEDDAEELDKTNPLFSAKGDSSFWLYFLDIIPTESRLGNYSIEFLGKRTENIDAKMATTMFRENPKDLIVITETELADFGGDMILEDLKVRGQAYAVIKDIQNQMFIPPTIKPNKDRMPYSAISGNPQKLEPLIFTPKNHKPITLGGKFSGSLLANQDAVGNELVSSLRMTQGIYLNPLDSNYYELKDPSNFIVPFINDKDTTEYAFLAYIKNKSARMEKSGANKYFAVIYYDGKNWYYSKQGEDKKSAIWAKFEIDTKSDIIVSILEQTVYRSQNDLVPSYGSGRVDVISAVFNIRDSQLEGLFVLDGGVDLFSAIRTLIYQHTSTADAVSIECLPVYQLEPNTLIYLSDEASRIEGVFMITSYSINISAEGSPLMTINAIETRPRI